jgi:hypothetical protein
MLWRWRNTSSRKAGGTSGRHQRAENTGGNVSKDFYTFNQLGYNIETGQQFHGGDLWAKLLCCSNERKIDRLRSGGGGP